MNSHWLRAEREMSQIGRGSLNFRLAIGEMNFSQQGSFLKLCQGQPRSAHCCCAVEFYMEKKRKPFAHVCDNRKALIGKTSFSRSFSSVIFFFQNVSEYMEFSFILQKELAMLAR